MSWNKWLKETAIAEQRLKRIIGSYISININGVSLDGSFTPSQLREIADIVENRLNKIEEN